MAYDIQSVSAAMDQKIRQLDAVTHNLANAATPGFKAEHLRLLVGLEEQGTQPEQTAPLSELVVDFSRGLPQQTNNPLDLCLLEAGFFVVQTGEGEAYTRKGDFTVNSLHQLVTQAGEPVLGEGGPITLRAGQLRVDEDGSVHVDDGLVARLRIVDFGNLPALRAIGGGLYRDDGTAAIRNAERPRVSSGFVESSNVNIVREMAEMIDIHRSFETYQKIVQTFSEIDKLATSRLGRIS